VLRRHLLERIDDPPPHDAVVDSYAAAAPARRPRRGRACGNPLATIRQQRQRWKTPVPLEQPAPCGHDPFHTKEKA
jgi:hypothetical protein